MEKRGQEVKYLKENDLKRIREYLKLKNKIVILSLVNIGVNVGLRISDLSKLRFENIGRNGLVKLKEKKTGKTREIHLNKTCQKAIKDLKVFYKGLGYSDKEGYLFKSLNRAYVKDKIDRPITTSGISKIFNEIRDMLAISYPIGTHSLRKTWGYMVYKGTLNIAIIMRAFNHSSAEQTLKYIGIEQENINRLYEEFEI
nr:tyrosine-type recombinase/integrase [uncultured Cetobacterium sp.]